MTDRVDTPTSNQIWDDEPCDSPKPNRTYIMMNDVDPLKPNETRDDETT